MSNSVLFDDDATNIQRYLSHSLSEIDTFKVIGSIEVTPLMNAVIHERKDVIDILIQNGCNVNMKDKDGCTALHYSCIYNPNNCDIPQKLVDAGGNASIKNNNGFTPLHYAARASNDINVIDYLLRISDPNALDNCGCTPLMKACAVNDNEKILTTLINVSSDINLADEDKNTALHLSCFWGDYQATTLLIKAGANFSLKNNIGSTCYDCADPRTKKFINSFTN